MKIAIAGDHAGFDLRMILLAELQRAVDGAEKTIGDAVISATMQPALIQPILATWRGRCNRFAWLMA